MANAYSIRQPLVLADVISGGLVRDAGLVVGSAAFVVAAGLVGWFAERGWDRSPIRTAVLMLGGTIIIIAIGTVWLAATIDVSLARALDLGVYPFLPGDLVKVAAAAGLLPTAWKLVGRSQR